jgi:hypothetical protein
VQVPPIGRGENGIRQRLVEFTPIVNQALPLAQQLSKSRLVLG